MVHGKSGLIELVLIVGRAYLQQPMAFCHALLNPGLQVVQAFHIEVRERPSTDRLLNFLTTLGGKLIHLLRQSVGGQDIDHFRLLKNIQIPMTFLHHSPDRVQPSVITRFQKRINQDSFFGISEGVDGYMAENFSLNSSMKFSLIIVGRRGNRKDGSSRKIGTSGSSNGSFVGVEFIKKLLFSITHHQAYTTAGNGGICAAKVDQFVMDLSHTQRRLLAGSRWGVFLCAGRSPVF